MSFNRPDSSLLVRFYDPQICAPDSRGRTLDQILAYSDEELEQYHDYIQILFPLPEPSPLNLSAPIVDSAVFGLFRSRDDLRARLRQSFQRILRFYGFSLTTDAQVTPSSSSTGGITGGSTRIIFGPNHETAFPNWVQRFDHNHLRITRILRSLRLLGLADEEKAFWAALIEVNATWPCRISERSIGFWRRAVARPLYLAPEEDGNGQGITWIRDWEQSQAK